MNVDSFIEKGRGHAICEDYVVMGNTSPSVAFAIVSDGCSSVKDADVGARVLAHCAAIQVRKRLGTMELLDILSVADWRDYIVTSSVPMAELIVSQLGLHKSCLSCTLVIAMADDWGRAKVIIMGDGGFILQRKDGSRFSSLVSFSHNAPYYPVFAADRRQTFLYRSACDAEISKASMIVQTGQATNSEKSIQHSSTYTEEPGKGYEATSFDLENVRGITIFSDGMFSFRKLDEATSVPIDSWDILQQTTAFKNYQGEFVQRRLLKFFEKARSEDVFNCDDFSMASLIVGVKGS